MIKDARLLHDLIDDVVIKGVDRAIIMKDQERMLLIMDIADVVCEFIGQHAN